MLSRIQQNRDIITINPKRLRHFGFRRVRKPINDKRTMRVINLEAGRLTLDEARRRLLNDMEAARRRGVRLLKIIHGWGSSGAGGTLGPGIRRSLRLRVKEGKALTVIVGERFSSDTNESRELLQRHLTLRRDRDLNHANPGITIVELAGLSHK